MRGLSSAITGLFKSLTAMDIPSWAVFGALALLAWYLVPKLAHSMEMDRARRIVKNANMGDGTSMESAKERALKVAGEDPQGLFLLAEEAVRQGRDDLAREAIGRLRATGKRPKEVTRLERELLGPLPGTVIEAVIVVESHLESGTWALARQKLTRFRTRWPDDPELTALSERLEREAPPEAAEGAAHA